MDKKKIVADLKALRKQALAWNGNKLVTVDVSPTVFEREGLILVSGEDGHDWCDYYGELRGGFPYIDPALEKYATERKMYWEWENPGCIYLCE
jgi:hypothetical protein